MSGTAVALHNASGLEARRASGAVILADTSGSMAVCDGGSTVRRIDYLARVLAALLSRHRLQALVAFSSVVEEVPLSGRVRVPEPMGSTDLAQGLEYVSGIRPVPTRCIVLCDGQPDDAVRALAMARVLRPMPIDAYFCGNELDFTAAAFMKDLAREGGPGGVSGRFRLSDVQAIAEAITLRIGYAGAR